MSLMRPGSVAGCIAFQEQAQGQDQAGTENSGAEACCGARPPGAQGGVPGAAAERDPKPTGGQTQTGAAEAE